KHWRHFDIQITIHQYALSVLELYLSDAQARSIHLCSHAKFIVSAAHDVFGAILAFAPFVAKEVHDLLYIIEMAKIPVRVQKNGYAKYSKSVHKIGRITRLDSVDKH